MTIAEWLQAAGQTLCASGCPDPEIDARWMLEDFLSLSPMQLRMQRMQMLTDDETGALGKMLLRRESGEPVQYITGRADFMGLRFHVDKRVLIPRQDTETLVEAALNVLKTVNAPSVLDVCTGSGAIGLAIGKLKHGAHVTCTDISADALDVTRMNAQFLGMQARILQGDLFAPVLGETFDMIASNPPYIPCRELTSLQTEVKFEPSLALDGGGDGLVFYKRIANEAAGHLNPRGTIFLEVGIGQAQQVLGYIAGSIQCAESGIIKDLNGIERVVWARSV